MLADFLSQYITRFSGKGGDLPAAYRAFAEGRATKEQAELILHDLCFKFHVVQEHDGSAYKEGQRSVPIYILRQIRGRRATPRDSGADTYQPLADREVMS